VTSEEKPLMRAVRVPEHVHYAEASEGGVALLNAKTGQWHLLNRTARQLWEQCRTTGDLDAALTALTSRYSRAEADRARSDAEGVAGALLDRGLLVRERRRAAASRRTAVERAPAVRTLAAGTPRHEPVPDQWPPRLRDRLAGLTGLVLALCLLCLPFRMTARTVTVVKRLLSRAAATNAQAERAVLAVHHAARCYPGRVACLELSLGAVMALALAGRGLDWCLGCAGDALRFHAWVETDGGPIPDMTNPGSGPFREILRL
jgi:Transglutaminase-like superfamily/Coenzyme PQQ synthesis protein D (PqqD)